jgi:hypothetical protein
MRVKKCTTLFLAILLLVSNFGLAINVHYCGDKIAFISSAFTTVETSKKDDASAKNCCCKTDDALKDACCKNKVVDLKKNSKDIIIKNLSFHLSSPYILVKSNELIFAKAEQINLNVNESEYYCNPNARPLFKLYKQYIFYA